MNLTYLLINSPFEKFLKNMLKLIRNKYKGFFQMITIHYDDEKLLRQTLNSCPVPITEIDKQQVLEMYEYLKLSQDEEYAKKHKIRAGVGLAANQRGLNKRMLAIYLHDDKEYSYALINPVVKSRSIQQAYISSGEGCLSVKKDKPGYVYRSYKITVEAYDAIQDKDITIKATGYLAICLQHELDHLDGILYYDRIDKYDPFKKIENAIEI